MVYKVIILLILLIVAVFCVLIFMQLRLISNKMDNINCAKGLHKGLNEGFRGMK